MLNPIAWSQFPRYDFFSNCEEGIYFKRSWFPMGDDVLVIARKPSRECFEFCEGTGENSDAVVLITSRSISTDDFVNVMANAVAAGTLDQPEHSARLSTAHSDDYYFVKAADGRQNGFHIRGGYCPDERINEFKEFLLRRGLDRFYRR